MNYSRIHSIHLAKRVYFTLLLFFPCLLFAQKNAPVAGDAALLTDLLKKDYSTLEPDVRREQLAKDRTIVIGTLKRYLTEEEQNSLNKKTSEGSQNNDANFLEFKTKQQALSAFTAKSYKDLNDLENIQKLVEEIENCKKEYYDSLLYVDIKNLENLFDVYKTSNQYLAFIANEFKTKYESLKSGKDDSFAEAMQETSVQKALPFIGGDLGFEVIIDGLSKFLAERIKEEMTAAVIERIQNYLRNPGSNDPLAELKILLPRTQDYLLSFRASQMVNFPDEIKQYIEDDLQHLPEQLGKLGQTPRVRRLVAQNPELDFALEALELIPNLSKIKNPVDLFDLLENSRNISRWGSDSANATKYNLANTIKFSSLLAHSLTVIDNGEMRLAGADFLAAYSSEIPFHLMYFGFLHQQNVKYYDVRFNPDREKQLTYLVVDISNNNSKTIPLSYLTSNVVNVIHKNNIEDLTNESINTGIKTELEEIKAGVTLFSELCTIIGSSAEKVYTSAQLIKKARKSGTSIGADTIYTFVNDIIDLIEGVTYSSDTIYQVLINHLSKQNCNANVCINTSIYPTEYTFCITDNSKNEIPRTFELYQKVEPYLAVARKSNDIVYDLQQKDYATAMIKALELTTDLRLGSNSQPYYESILSLTKILPDIGGLKKIDFKDTLNEKWHAKEWCDIFSIIRTTTVGAKINKKTSSANTVLSEIRSLQTYIENSNICCIEDLQLNINSLKGEIYNISQEQPITIKITEAQNLLNDDRFKSILISYYTGVYFDNWILEIRSELINSGRYTPDERATIISAIISFKNGLFDYLATQDRENFNKCAQNLRLIMNVYLDRVVEYNGFQLSESTIKVIHFINDMAKAENSDDVKNAIDAIASPAGSYSIKREQKFSVSLNSYPGLLVSVESAWKNGNPYNTFSTSFTAPVGINLGWGTKKGRSHSIFAPIIDVGALTRMYLVDRKYTNLKIDTTTQIATLPELNFINVFSPGLYYAIGFRNTPISIYAGFQFGPYLREIKNVEGDAKTVSNIKTTRLSVGLTLDIPLWNISSKSRL